MNAVVLNSVHLDWLTLTTFDRSFIDVMSAIFPAAVGAEARRLQYDGWQSKNSDGSVFFGTAEQGGRPHFMVQTSGYRADSSWRAYAGTVASGSVRVTRLDLALTVLHERENWSQAALFERLREAFPSKAISYVESVSGPQGEKLATVYVGSRSSDRLLRIYEKVIGSDASVGLRCEVEFKGDRAQLVAEALNGGSSVAAIFRAELERLRDEQLYALYIPYLRDDPTVVRVKRSDGDTERWLLGQVLPVLRRVMNEHGNEADFVRFAFLHVLLNSSEEPASFERSE